MKLKGRLKDVHAPKMYLHRKEGSPKDQELMYDNDYHLGIIVEDEHGIQKFESATIDITRRLDLLECKIDNSRYLKIIAVSTVIISVCILLLTLILLLR